MRTFLVVELEVPLQALFQVTYRGIVVQITAGITPDVNRTQRLKQRFRSTGDGILQILVRGMFGVSRSLLDQAIVAFQAGQIGAIG